MKRSRRSARPARTSRLWNTLGNGLRRLSGAAALAESAGTPGANFEQLEERQLLFSLVVDPSDPTFVPGPGPGFGSVTAQFGYFIPYLAPTVAAQTQQAQTQTANFDQAPPPNGPFPSGTVFQQGLRVFLNNGAGGSHVVGQNNVGFLRFVLAPGQSTILDVIPQGLQNQDPDNGPILQNPTGLDDVQSLRNMLFQIGGLNGLDPSSTTVELRRRLPGGGMEVLASFTGAQLAALSNGGGAFGTFTFNAPADTTTGAPGSFDEVRIVNTGGQSLSFDLDNEQSSEVAGNLTAIVASRIFGSVAVLSGPIGASAQFLDLYGREMVPTLFLGKWDQQQNALRGDLNDDGVPEYNDGIGRINITNSNALTQLTVWGTTVTGTGETGFATPLPTNITGFQQEFHQAGFGNHWVQQPGSTTFTVTGLAPAVGSVVIGSAFVRNLANYNPTGSAIITQNVTGGFNRTDQGIFVQGGAGIGSVYVDGILHGSSQFTGFADRVILGALMGSMTVAGDLGLLMTATDAGEWVGTVGGGPQVKTGSQIVIGRTLGEIAVGGRMMSNVTVIGDLNSSATRPARDILRHYENEYITGIPVATTPPVPPIINDILGNNNAMAFDRLFRPFFRTDQSLIFGTGLYRNDTIMSAEWIGTAATSVEVHGELGINDPINTKEDPSDVYGFAVDGTSEVQVRLNPEAFGFAPLGYFRLVDSSGRTVAAINLNEASQSEAVIRYRPSTPGVLYLVVQSSSNGTAVTDNPYVLTVSGMAATTAGAIHSAAGMGLGQGNVVNVLSGSLGSLRAGTGFVNGAGAETDPAGAFNVFNGLGENTIQGYMDLRTTSLSVAGSLYNISLGADMQFATMTVGGNLGSIVTGLSGVVGTGFQQGDLLDSRIVVGGSIAFLDIRGAVGIDNDAVQQGTPPPVDLPNTVIIKTGQTPTMRGDIGLFRVGGDMGADTLSVRTPNGSVFGGLLVSQDGTFNPGGDSGIYLNAGASGNGEDIRLGINSDLRFFDVPRIELNNFEDIFTPLLPGVPQVFTDDGGAQFRVTLTAGDDPTASGLVRLIPITGSLGAAVGRIEVNLVGGARLQITSLGTDPNAVVSIGRIIVTGATASGAGALPSIGIDGGAQVDVWRIEQTGGTVFGSLSNTTPNGDIVAADLAAITTLTIGTGDLGRTQVPAWGPREIGPFLGVAVQQANTVGGPIAVDTPELTPVLGAFRPVNDSNNVPGHEFLDDVGSPVDGYLNGLLVRGGNITSVTVGGAIGDVIATDFQNTSTIGTVTPNSGGLLDNVFRGLIGDLYAVNIVNVDIGDGLAQREQNAMSSTGIFASGPIGSVTGGRIHGANISSSIVGAAGINTVQLSGGGSYIDAFIGAANDDAFWTSAFGAETFTLTDITLVTGTDANLLRSEIVGNDIATVTLNNGFWDGSLMRASGNVGTITTIGYRNTTIGGGELELHQNSIIVGGNLGTLTTFGRTGDIVDLTVNVIGRTNEISANNMVRLDAESAQGYNTILTVDSLRSSSIRGGTSLATATFGKSVRSSEIAIAGQILLLTAGDQMTNTRIVVSGPDGSIGTIRARTLFTGSIVTTGHTNLIEVTEGNFIGSVTTLTSLRGVPGDIDLIQAAGDLDLTADIAGTVTRMVSGLNIGNIVRKGVIFVRGNVLSVEAPNGQIYSDFRVGQTLTNVVIGRVTDKPGVSFLSQGSIIAFGRIETVTINGDFAGQIISYSGGIGFVTINDGSLLPGASIQAFDGTINNILINRGNLYGDIHADYMLLSLRLNGSDDGVFGDIGVSPFFDQGDPYDAFRNKLPPGVVATAALQGPRITAGQNIGRIILTNGTIYEATIYAKRAIGTIDVTGDVRNDTATAGTGNVIAAGSSVNVIHVTGAMSDTFVLVGVRSFGDDGRPGGTGANADVIQSGRMTSLAVDGAATNVLVNAGITPGPDGVYNSGDEQVAMGISYVRSVTASNATNVVVLADSPTLTVSPGVVRGGTNLLLADPDLSNGDPGAGAIELVNGGTRNFSWGGVPGTIFFSTDKGQAFWNPTTGQITLLNTSLNTQLVVSSPGNTLTDFRIVTNDDASMGTVRVDAALAGASKIVIDAYVLQIQTGDVQHADIRVGMNLRNLTTGNFQSGTITDPFWLRDTVINGSFGTPDTFDEARIDMLAGNSVSISGNDAGLINVDRDLVGLAVGGAMDHAQVRAGNSLSTVSAAALSNTRISVGDTLGQVIVTGDVNDTLIQAGGDLGSDVASGGSGEAADTISSGFIGSMTIGGNFLRSSAVAGLLRGPDGFFGTQDDIIAPGRSTIGNVTIGGSQVGSGSSSQQFRISATGTLGTVTIAGQPPTNDGNFKVVIPDAQPLPIRVVDLQSTPDALIWTTRIYFNQPMNISTIGPALTVFEVRDGGSTLVPLAQGTDYTVGDWDPLTNSIGIRFSRDVTDRNLPQQPGVPGPGVFRFNLDAAVLRASVDSARLDGNGDGFAAANESFSKDDVVGDAGDKFVAESDVVDGQTIDFYAPTDLDVVLDNNQSPDALPDPNLTYTVRGVIGDHPDTDVINFPTGGDTDIFKITLQAGQIFRMGALQGAARLVGRFLLNAAGEVQGGNTADTESLPVNPLSVTEDTLPQDFLIKTTGVYFIVLTNVDIVPDDFGPGLVPNIQAGDSNTGAYTFTIQIFDDRNTGFAAGTDAGNGDNIVNAPPIITFAGNDGVFGNADDRTSVPIGDFTFFLDPGPDGVKGTNDDVVSGGNAQGIVSTRTGRTNLTTVIDSAIGPAGHAGFPADVTSDIDIYNLNNGALIPAGKQITVKIKLSDLGANLGGFSQLTFSDFSSDVQFGIFDVTDASGIDDGKLVASPTDFKAVAGTPNTLLAHRGDVSYGYDENGDFFLTFVTPGKLGGTAGEAARYAIYLQGAFNTDYQIVVTQADTPQVFSIPHGPQNVFLETSGGVVSWLEAAGLPTKLLPFAGSVLGFTGTINSQPIDQYILTHLVSTLQSIASASGLALNFSTDSSTFEFQNYSTVFLSASSDPKTAIGTANFGYSQHSDPFNADPNDQAVVFTPSLATLGYTPSQADVDNFVQSLAAAVGRRVGELVGLRITADSGFGDDPVDIMSANSVFNVPQAGSTFAYVNTTRSLSDPFDSVVNTDFFLGQQNAFELLSKFLAP